MQHGGCAPVREPFAPLSPELEGAIRAGALNPTGSGQVAAYARDCSLAAYSASLATPKSAVIVWLDDPGRSESFVTDHLDGYAFPIAGAV